MTDYVLDCKDIAYDEYPMSFSNKTLLDSNVVEDYFQNKKIWAFDYLKTRTPTGCAVWQWAAFKINGELHILEIAFDENDSQWVLGIINCTM